MMAEHSYFLIDDYDPDRTPLYLRYPDSFQRLIQTVLTQRDIPDDVEIAFVIHKTLFTVGDLRREMERH